MGYVEPQGVNVLRAKSVGEEVLADRGRRSLLTAGGPWGAASETSSQSKPSRALIAMPRCTILLK